MPSAIKLSTSSKAYAPDDLLADKYPLRKKREKMPEIDPDHGAQCDWRSLKAALKSRTEAMKAAKGKTARRRR